MSNPESLQPSPIQSELSREVTTADSDRIKEVTAQIEEILSQFDNGDLTNITQEQYRKLDPDIRRDLVRLSEKLERLVKGEHQKVFENEILTPEILEKQLDDQKEAYLAVGLLKENDQGVAGFEVNGEFYPFPTIEEVHQYLTENKVSEEFFQEKIGQGFKELRVMPFYLPLDYMIEKIDSKVAERGGEKTFKDKEWLDPNTLNTLKYNICLDLAKDDIDINSGFTKEELAEDEPSHPYVYKGYTIGLININQTNPPLKAIEYLNLVSDPNSEHYQESAMFLEEWLGMFAQYLYINLIQENRTISASRNLLSDFEEWTLFANQKLASGRIPRAYWERKSNSLSLAHPVRLTSYYTLMKPRSVVRRIA